MKSLPAKKLIKILRENGFVLSRQKGSHQIWKNPHNEIIVPVPLHGELNPLPIGTFLKIVKQSKISLEKFKY